MDIKAIQTHYNGYYFRSRLEARWAVFFDSIGIKYLYEPEGFTSNGVCYLPDFYFPEYDIYVEVKPNAKSLIKDFWKIEACIKDKSTPIAKGLLVLGQIPHYSMNVMNDDGECEFIPHFNLIFWDNGIKVCDAVFISSKRFNKSKNKFSLFYFRHDGDEFDSDKFQLLDDDLYYLSPSWNFSFQDIVYEPQPSFRFESANYLLPHFEKARSARFEFKEKK